MRAILPLLVFAAASCSSVRDAPSLAPRASEGIDPRLPVADTSAATPADPALAAELAPLVSAAHTASGRFEVAIARAEQLAAAAGPRQSDSWVAAQQALSAAVAERYPVTRALADIDALATARVVGGRQLGLADQQAVRDAAAAVGAIDARQAARVAAVQRRLGG
ncbi:hypothetical protein [uncultured Sphingomonas sp.]|uniref:hypothetical protein n=1 Tax=uncultured Sphingomonas sp. TaxID=158754 RepID=UPI0025E9986D|nr:hypothetical protein [uncultured Sphingomonas sp.]